MALPLPSASASQASISILNPLEVPDWDTQISVLPGATFFHTAAWARVLHDTYGYRPQYLVSQRSGRLHSVFPLMEVDSWLTGRRGVALPFTDACEALCPDADTFQILFESAKSLAVDRNWRYLECRGGRSWMREMPASTTFFNHTLPLVADDVALFQLFDESTRRAVRKAERNAIDVEFSQSLEAMKTFYGLNCRTRKRHGVPPQPFPFFANIQRRVLDANHGWIVLARHRGRAVAGAVYFHFCKSALYKFGASDENFQHFRANNFVMWHAIRRYARAGYTSFDFGRTSINNEGLRRYKLSWSTREHLVEYVRYDPGASRYVTAPDRSDGWRNRMFRVLPVFLSRLLGSAFYRHIA